jgi:phosphohistidine phosphatase
MEQDLSAKGRRQAESIGQWMSGNGIMPDRIISSSAKRTKFTAKICSGQIGYKKSLCFEDSLYDAGIDTYLDILAALHNTYNSVMMVGHNPAISSMVAILTGDQINMSPCMLVSIETDIDEWCSVKGAHSSLKWFQIPS